MISLKSALQQMRMKDNRGRFVPFSVEFVTCDLHKKTGGELVRYDRVTLPQREQVEVDALTRSVDKPTVPSKKTTVTFKISETEFRQCHIWLITRFNNETVF